MLGNGLSKSLFSPRIIICLIVAGLLIVVSKFLEIASGEGVGKHTGSSTSETGQNFLELSGFALHEIGFGLLVAVITWALFEHFSSKQSEEQWNERIETIAQNVFMGVFRRNFPKPLIDEANDLILEQKLIRTSFHVSYIIEDSECSDGNGGTLSYVKMAATVRFKMRNISNQKTEFPLSVLLPNPITIPLKEQTKVHKITTKMNGSATTHSLDEAESRFREALMNDAKSQIPFSAGHVVLDPGQEVEIISEYTMAKEEEDTEIFQTSYPAESIYVTIVDKNPGHRYVRARTIHRVNIENDSASESQGVYNYHLDKYLLPQQGFVFWWKIRKDLRS